MYTAISRVPSEKGKRFLNDGGLTVAKSLSILPIKIQKIPMFIGVSAGSAVCRRVASEMPDCLRLFFVLFGKVM